MGNNNQFMQFLADALRQRSMSPDPSYDAMGRPAQPSQPTVQPQMPGYVGEGQDVLMQDQLRKQQMLEQMRQQGM